MSLLFGALNLKRIFPNSELNFQELFSSDFTFLYPHCPCHYNMLTLTYTFGHSTILQFYWGENRALN